MFQNLEDCLLRGEKIRIEIEFSIQDDGDPVVDIIIEKDGDVIFSDLSFVSLDDALTEADKALTR